MMRTKYINGRKAIQENKNYTTVCRSKKIFNFTIRNRYTVYHVRLTTKDATDIQSLKTALLVILLLSKDTKKDKSEVSGEVEDVFGRLAIC